jgi:hypothetical protein
MEMTRGVAATITISVCGGYTIISADMRMADADMELNYRLKFPVPEGAEEEFRENMQELLPSLIFWFDDVDTAEY